MDKEIYYQLRDGKTYKLREMQEMFGKYFNWSELLKNVIVARFVVWYKC